MSENVGVRGRTVLIAGASGPAATAVARDLVAAGARVLGVARNQEHLDALRDAIPDADTRVCDLTSPSAVAELAMRIHVKFGPIDGLVHLVGGWRGGGGIPGQSDDDWEFLSASLTSLRIVSRTFYDDLVASQAGRLAIVSSTSVERPSANSASYAAIKAASDAWTRAVAQGFRAAKSPAAASIFVVTSLAGLEDRLAQEVVGLWSVEPVAINGARISLTPSA